MTKEIDKIKLSAKSFAKEIILYRIKNSLSEHETLKEEIIMNSLKKQSSQKKYII